MIHDNLKQQLEYKSDICWYIDGCKFFLIITDLFYSLLAMNNRYTMKGTRLWTTTMGKRRHDSDVIIIVDFLLFFNSYDPRQLETTAWI